VVCLAGGVGAAKLLQGLVEVIPQRNITVIVNTGDDITLHGLHISPDPDIVMYTLAGIVNPAQGWGVKDDTFNCLQMLHRYGLATWFKLGDKDLATHILRTQLLKKGYSLTEVTHRLCTSLGVETKLLPVTNDSITPQIITEKGKLHFEEYLVKNEAKDKVLNVIFEGVSTAEAAPGVIESIYEASGIIICPSNPIVSIGPILAVRKVRAALRETKAKVVAISPIVGGATIKGPADKLMQGLGLEVSASSVAFLYRDVLDAFILDKVDEAEKAEIENLGIQAVVANTVMRSLEDKTALARLALDSLHGQSC
jgi:LPPG:FO 2-phospho-L-lactate transferase